MHGFSVGVEAPGWGWGILRGGGCAKWAGPVACTPAPEVQFLYLRMATKGNFSWVTGGGPRLARQARGSDLGWLYDQDISSFFRRSVIGASASCKACRLRALYCRLPPLEGRSGWFVFRYIASAHFARWTLRLDIQRSMNRARAKRGWRHKRFHFAKHHIA